MIWDYFKNTAICIIIVFAVVSCSASKELAHNPYSDKSNCFNHLEYSYTKDQLPDPAADLSSDFLVSSSFSEEARQIAHAFNFFPLLVQYVHLKKDSSSSVSLEKRLAVLELQQKINSRISNASLQISSVTSELDCEEKRAAQLSNYLKNKVGEKEEKLVVGSIIIGATGAITAEILSNSESTEKSASYVAVGTSLVEATLGILLLTNKKKIQFTHQRNSLAEIWEAPATSKTLPASVWYFLNFRDQKNHPESIRESLVKSWENFGQIKKSRKQNMQAEREIYFGQGGIYTYQQLKNRAEMYGQIEAYINIMKQNLDALAQELENFESAKN